MDPKEAAGNDAYHVCGWALKKSENLRSYKDLHPEYIDLEDPNLFSRAYFDKLQRNADIASGKI